MHLMKIFFNKDIKLKITELYKKNKNNTDKYFCLLIQVCIQGTQQTEYATHLTLCIFCTKEVYRILISCISSAIE